VKYRLIVESRAKKDLQALDSVTQRRVAKKLKYFLAQENPLQHAKKLADTSGGDYRWRIGNFRAVFDVDNNDIKLLRVQHRREVYRK
jgi:mRNA interferase RelE/StbE